MKDRVKVKEGKEIDRRSGTEETKRKGMKARRRTE